VAESHLGNVWFDDEAGDGVEAMIRAAGQYVRPTDDLRPRVLEAARLHSGERWAKRRICQVGMLVIWLAFFSAANHGLDFPQSRRTGMLAAAGINELVSPAAAAATAAPRSGDGDWRMTDAFTELRRQQAQMLRFPM
jgi:hypothetical protein